MKSVLSNLLIGIPGGCLIFMGMLMFNALLGKWFPTGGWVMLGLLCFTALVVGLLARWMRPFHGLGAAVAAGVVAALIILFLWLNAAPGSEGNLSFGPAGMLAVLSFSAFGGWLLPRLRRGAK